MLFPIHKLLDDVLVPKRELRVINVSWEQVDTPGRVARSRAAAAAAYYGPVTCAVINPIVFNKGTTGRMNIRKISFNIWGK